MADEDRTEGTEEGAQATEAAEPYRAFKSKDELQAFIDASLKERLERKDRKAEEERSEAERKAREDALKEQEDWKRLAEERTNTIAEKDRRIEELSALETERDSANERTQALEERLKGLIKPQLEAVPELYRPFVEKMTVEEQAEWLEQNAEKLGTQNGPGRAAGSRPTGRAHTPPRQEADREAREHQRRAGVSAI